MDNIYFKNSCPALMQDARFLTTYHNPRWLDQKIRKENNVYHNDNYKEFIQQNSKILMINESTSLLQNNNCKYTK
jgi:hypothetical protein